MGDPNQYTMLMASLPYHGALFAAKRTPINRIKLDARLRVLAPEHRRILDLIEDTLLWYRLPLGLEEAEILARDRKAMAEIESETLRQVIRDRLELRTCMAALRRRFAGEAAAPAGRDWGYGRWLNHIARNWSEPGFRLEGAFPWLREADRLLRDGDTLGLERLVLAALWQSLGRHTAAHEFDFEAVVIYVLRWNVIDRWTRYDSAAAVRRFTGLVESALGEQSGILQGGLD